MNTAAPQGSKAVRDEVARENYATLSALTTAIIPLMEVTPDVIGDDDKVMITVPYETFEHLAWIMAPLLPGGPEKFAAYKIWPGMVSTQGSPEPLPQVWRPISEAPKDGAPIHVARWTDMFGGMWVRGWATWEDLPGLEGGWISRGYFDPPGELGLAHPTHWCPLPSPPGSPLPPEAAKQALVDQAQDLDMGYGKPLPQGEDALERLCKWAMSHGFATGHADTVEDLLSHVGDQIDEQSSKLRAAMEALQPFAKSGGIYPLSTDDFQLSFVALTNYRARRGAGNCTVGDLRRAASILSPTPKPGA